MTRWHLELSMLTALLASLLTIPLPLPHIATTTVWTTLTAVHVARRHRIYAALLRSAHSSTPPAALRRQRRLAASTMLIGCTAVVTLSGFAQWAGIAAAIPWHAGSSTLLIVLAAAHASRRLRRRRAKAVRPRGSAVGGVQEAGLRAASRSTTPAANRS